jgi:hypothetical protein
MKVEDIAHTHSGDKGDSMAVSVFVYDEAHWPLLRERLTAERVRAKFGDLVKGDVVRFELPSVHGLNFALFGALSGGHGGLRVDGLGKTYQSLMLDIDLGPDVREPAVS